MGGDPARRTSAGERGIRHVCLYTDSREPSGVGEHMLALASGLRARYTVSFVCPATSAGVPFLERSMNLGVETVAIGAGADGEAHGPLREYLARRHVDVFHGHAGIAWEGHVGVRCARAAGVPVVVRTEHLPYLLTDARHRDEYALSLANVDAVICVSAGASATFVEAGIDVRKVSVVRNGLASQRPCRDRAALRDALDVPLRAPVVLSVGRMTEQKGHRYLIDAVPKVLARVPNAHLLIVGTGPLAHSLAERVVALGVTGAVRFLGHRGDVRDLLRAADVFVLPSLFEGLPVVVLEAMAAGLPVVATRVVGSEEAVDHERTGRLVDAGNSAQLATALVEVLERPALAAKWGRAGRRRFERLFTAERMVNETIAVYERVHREVR